MMLPSQLRKALHPVNHGQLVTILVEEEVEVEEDEAITKAKMPPGEKALEDGEGAVSQEVEATIKEDKPAMP